MITHKKMLPNSKAKCNISVFILKIAMFTLACPYTEYPRHAVLISVFYGETRMKIIFQFSGVNCKLLHDNIQFPELITLYT